MFSISEFLDRAKAGAGNCTDYRLAKLVGVTTQAVSAWRSGRTAPDVPAILKLCALSGDDAEHVAACIQSMRAANDDAAELWRRVADRLRGGANVLLMTAVALLLGATMLGWTDEAAASLSNPASGSLYIMLSVVAVRLCYRFGIKQFRAGWRIAHP